MECNREQAERCIQIAVEAFKEFKTQRAENFLKRAEQLYPTHEAKGNIIHPFSSVPLYVYLSRTIYLMYKISHWMT